MSTLTRKEVEQSMVDLVESALVTKGLSTKFKLAAIIIIDASETFLEAEVYDE